MLEAAAKHAASSAAADLQVLVPYLIGFASALLVQLVTQFYFVPRVEGRKRREQRWEQDVIALGELLTNDVARMANDVFSDWLYMMLLRDNPDDDEERQQREVKAQLNKAREATDALNDLVRFRASWIADQVFNFRPSAEKLWQFDGAFKLYYLKLIEHDWWEVRDMTRDQLADERKAQRDRLWTVIDKVRELAAMRQPPRASFRQRLGELRSRLAKNKVLGPISKFFRRLPGVLRHPIRSTKGLARWVKNKISNRDQAR